jgi:peptidyl-prolyl cis-trans isomerase SurA
MEDDLMFIRKLILPIIPLALLLFSCVPEHSKIVVAEYGDYEVLLGDFEKAYAKNSGGFEKARTDSFEAYKKFLDLYVNYRMKLRDAVVRGYTRDEDMKKELTDYKINIGTTLFLEDKLYEPALKKMYERRKTEYKAAHIMLIPDSVMNEVQVKELGNQIIASILNGADFEKLALEYSKDEYTKGNGGVVGWVTSGMIIVPEIEEAIYSTEKGKIYPKLVKSNFGYHILKVVDKLPRRSQIKAQHILASFRDSSGVVDTAKAYQKMLDIEKKLKEGEDFGKLAMEYSDDKYSAERFGDLGFFGRGRMEPRFENAAFNLKVNEISPIVETSFGYHLIKLTAETPYPSYKENVEELKDLFKRISYKQEYDKLINQVKSELNYKVNEETFKSLIANSDSIQTGAGYENSYIQKQFGSKIICTSINRSFIVDSLFNFINNSSLYLGRFFNEGLLKEAIDKFIETKALQEKALTYDKEDADFAQLMEDYENGIYLFKILEDEVWSKVFIDSAMVQNYFNNHRENYKWKDRVEFKEIYTTSDSLINYYHSLALSGADFDSLVARYTQRKGYENISGYYGLVEVNVNDLAKQAFALSSIGDISKPFRFQDGWSIVKLVKKEKARLKDFEEVRAEVASLLQELESKRLEDEYVGKLKKIYKPELFYNELVNAFKN